MGDSGRTRGAKAAVSYAAPKLPSPFPDQPDAITDNLLLLVEQTPDPFVYQHLVKHLHAFVKETNLSTDEWMAAIKFLTRAGQACTPLRQEVSRLSNVLGVSALVDFLNNPVVGGATEGNPLGPFYTDDADDIEYGGSIASEGKGEYMYVEGRVLTTEGDPIPNAVVETWEADHDGFYDTQYADRIRPDCRGRLRTAKDGSFGYRAVVPSAYPIRSEGPVDQLLISQGRHNMHPSHIHIIVQAPGYRKLVTVFYIEGCDYLTSDAMLQVKKSLVVKLEQVDDDAEARKRGFQKGGSFKLLKRDIVLLTEEQSCLVREQLVRESERPCNRDEDD